MNGTLYIDPIVDLIVFGLNISTVPRLSIIPLTPAPSAVLNIVPRFPGSCIPSNTTMDILKNIKITPNGVAYIYVTKKIQKKYNLSNSDASALVSLVESIKGSLIWIAFIDMDDKSIRVRLRSRFTTVNQIAEKYHGGGHDRASGATCYNKKEMLNLINDADKSLKEYKESHEGWL